MDLALQDQPDLEAFTSNCMPQFIRRLSRVERPLVLDLGPLSNGNLGFLAGELGYRVRVEDLSHARAGPLDQAAAGLKLPEGCFVGVLAWSLLEQLDGEGARSLVKRLRSALTPGGLLIAFFSRRLEPEAPIQQFNFIDSQRLIIRQTRRQAPCRDLANREVLELFQAFEPVQSYILKSGVREFLFRRPGRMSWSIGPS